MKERDQLIHDMHVLSLANPDSKVLFDRIWNAALDEAATAIAQHDREGREWIRPSLWDTLSNEAAARVRALREPT